MKSSTKKAYDLYFIKLNDTNPFAQTSTASLYDHAFSVNNKSLIKLICFFTLILITIPSLSQIVSRASLMTVRSQTSYVKEQLYRSLPDGKTLITGNFDYYFIYGNYDSRNDTSAKPMFVGNDFIALTNSEGDILWVKYTTGLIRNLAFDSQQNIIITGLYYDNYKTSSGDAVSIPSNSLNSSGNIYIMKLDSLGNTKWIKTTDNESWLQSPPGGDYIQVDPDDNIYLAAHFNKFIRFDSTHSFLQLTSYGFSPLLAKWDSTGKLLWVRDWGFDNGLPNGLEIDSCRLNMFVTLGNLQDYTRLRKYDFAGKWIDEKRYTGYGYNWTLKNVDIKKELVAFFYNDYLTTRIQIHHINQTLLKEIPVEAFGIRLLNFTNNNNLFFSGECLGDSCKIANNTILKGITFGVLDTSGQLLWKKTINRTYTLRDNTLSEQGRFLFLSTINSSINPYSTFTIDTITFNNLSYQDSYMNYRFYAQFNLGDSLYQDLSVCTFSPPVDTCLDREGINRCNLVTSINDPVFDRSVSIFPNPVVDNITILITTGINHRYTVTLFSANGKLVRQTILKSGHNSINTKDLNGGIYFLKLRSQHFPYQTVTRKILIVRR